MNYLESILRMMEIISRKFVQYDKSGMKMNGSSIQFSFMDLLVIIELTKNGKSTMQELLGFFDVDRGIMTTVVNRLGAAGFLVKDKDTQDKRKTFIQLTVLGEQLYQEIAESEREALGFVLKEMTINEQKAVLKFLSRVNQLTVDKFALVQGE